MTPQEIKQAKKWIEKWRQQDCSEMPVDDVEKLARWADCEVNSQGSHRKLRHSILKGFAVHGYGLGGHIGYAVKDGKVKEFYVKRIVEAVELIIEESERNKP